MTLPVNQVLLNDGKVVQAVVTLDIDGNVNSGGSPGGATAVLQEDGNDILESIDLSAGAIDDKLPDLLNSRVVVDTLGQPATARQVATTVTSANQALTASGVNRISLYARISPLRYMVGSTSQTANNATSHYLAAGERIDIALPATPNIAVIRASDATEDGAAEITELI
jgi:hypothetical protein